MTETNEQLYFEKERKAMLVIRKDKKWVYKCTAIQCCKLSPLFINVIVAQQQLDVKVQKKWYIFCFNKELFSHQTHKVSVICLACIKRLLLLPRTIFRFSWVDW